MLAELPAYLAAVAGDALSYELLMLVTFCLILTIRHNLSRVLAWYRQVQDPTESLRSALWKLLRGQ